MEDKIKSLFDETHPLRLITHVQTKGVQLVSVVGFFGSSIYSLYTKKPYLKTVGKAAAYSAVIGFFLGSAMVAGKIYSLGVPLDHYSITDRSYRLAHNHSQRTLDCFTLIGSLAGMLTFPVFGGLLRGTSVGAALGTTAGLSYALYNKYSASTTTTPTTPSSSQ
eukprot:TRINITY_DN5700_c0_g1_i1.p1 TRINITY_DN5700_c0_g1~~TRINITY_DN5700_c0_g1_i1.p1  ORF type:complete len:164 (+),score=27.21 TRINITY_DN5700_c0_g1_i1:247-738(+)